MKCDLSYIETVRASLSTLLADLPPTAPLLVLAVATGPYSALPGPLQQLFTLHYKEIHRLENPTEQERR